MGSIVYWFLGSAEVQHWSKFDSDNLDAVDSNKSCEMENADSKSLQ